MARPIAFNRTGIFGIENQGAPVVTTTDVTYNFESHPYVNFPYNGLLIVKLNQVPAEGTTATLPLYFNTDGRKVPVSKANGATMTAGDVTETGYYLFFYDYKTNVLQAVNQVV